MKFWLNLKQLKNSSQLSWLSFGLLGLIVIALSLGQLVRLELAGATFYPHDVLVIVWILLQGTFTYTSFSKYVVKKLHTNIPLTFTIAWIILGMVVSFWNTLDMLPWLYLLRVTTYIFFLLLVSIKTKHVGLIPTLMSVAVGLSMLSFGLFQYWLLPDTRFLYQFGWDEHYYRLIGSLLDPNYTGLLLIVTGWSLYSLKEYLNKYMLISMLLLSCVGVALTFSRATYLSLIISVLGVSFIQAWKHRAVTITTTIPTLAVIAIVVIAIFLAPKPGGEGVDLFRTTSIAARYSSTSQFLTLLQPWQWVVGAGFYTRPPQIHSLTSHARVPDNVLVLLLYSFGVVGFGAILWQGLRMLPTFLQFDATAPAIALAVITHSQFNNSLLEPFVLLVVGLSLTGLISRPAKDQLR